MDGDAIVVGDTLSVLRSLPDDTFDVGVTSPPYNKGERHKGWLVDKVIYDSSHDAMPEAAYQDLQVAVLDELYRD